MKVLFAVKNESLSNAIIEKYRRKYKEILTFKNVYYYNAIIKELQKNKDYDRILISEELEDFANNNNYDTIDKFIFDKLDSISDEANDANGREISIIFICTDRRQKGDELLSKLFSIGVYNALIGDDRTYDSVCSLIKNPRTKKDAKNYYKIDVESSSYRAENENGVSEVEIQNILAHFRRLGKSTEKYVKSFDNIAAQYTEEQLRIIANCLPPKVKSVLATSSEKYKKLASTGFGLGVVADNNSKSNKKSSGIRVNTLENTTTKTKINKPIVIPAGVKNVKPKSVGTSEENTSGIRIQRKPTSLQEQIERRAIDEKERIAALKKQKEIEMQELGEVQKIKEKAPEKEKTKLENKAKDEVEDEDIFADEIFNDETDVKDKVEKFDEDIFEDVSDKDAEKIKIVPEKNEKEELSLDDDDDDDFNFNEDFLGDVEDVIETEDEPEFEIGKEDPDELEEESSLDELEEDNLNKLEENDDGFDFDDMFEENDAILEKAKSNSQEKNTIDDDEFDFEDAVLETSDEIESSPKSKSNEPDIEADNELVFDDDIFGESEDIEEEKVEEPKTSKPEVEEDDDFNFDDDDIFGESEDIEEEKAKESKTSKPELETDDEFDFDDDDIFGESEDIEEEKAQEPKTSKPELEDDDEFDFGDDDIFGESEDIEEEKVEEPKTSKPELEADDEFDFDDDDIFGESEDIEEETVEEPKTSKSEVEEDDDFNFDDDDDIFGESEDIEEEKAQEPKTSKSEVEEDDDFNFDDDDDIFGESEDIEEEKVEEPKTSKPELEADDEFDFDDDDIFGESEDIEEEKAQEPKTSKPEVEEDDDDFNFDDDDIFGESDNIEESVEVPKNSKSEVEEDEDIFDDIADIPGLDELDSDTKEESSDDNLFDDDSLFDDIADIPGVDDLESNDMKNAESESLEDTDDIDEDDNMFEDMVDIPGIDDLDDFADTTKNVQPQSEIHKSNDTDLEIDDDFDEDIFGDDELPVENNKIPTDTIKEDEELFEDLDTLPGLDDFDEEIFENDYEDNKEIKNSESKNVVESIKPKIDYSMSNLNKLLTKDKKIVNFVGTTKNGTSFLVNNLAKLFSSIGVNTAILDMTKNKNSYYIFTNNDDELRKIAQHSFEKLENGYAEGIRVDKNLTVYTNLPTDDRIYKNAETIFSTLLQSHTLILVDCDFDTDTSFFALCQELYLVQSLDILTMQPLTTFLRDLQVKEILEPEKLRVVINKDIKVRDLTPKAIIGGMSYYKDPGMSVMVELFNKDMVQACSIPFEDNTYSKYLEAIANCDISLSGYSKAFMAKLKNLGEMIYSLNSKPSYASSPITQDYNTRNKFSNNMNNTLKEMKKKF